MPRGVWDRPVRPLVDNLDGTLSVDCLHGRFAVIDTASVPIVAPYNWYGWYCPDTRSYYARRNITVDGRQHTLLMHRAIMGVTDQKIEVDHINHDTMNNRASCNLRIATQQENRINRRLQGGSSKYKGVCWHKRRGLWQAYIGIHGVQQSLGYFTSEVDAAVAYDTAALLLDPAFALLNFPKAA